MELALDWTTSTRLSTSTTLVLGGERSSWDEMGMSVVIM